MNFPSLASLILAGALSGLVAKPIWATSRDGLNGVDKTQSAETLGKNKVQASFQSHVINDERLLKNQSMTVDGKSERLSSLLLANNHLALGFGLTDSWDASLTMPFYYEGFVNPGTKAEGYAPGEIKVSLKYRTPWGSENRPWGLAFLAGAYGLTSTKGMGAIPREIEFIPRSGKLVGRSSRAFGTGRPEYFLTAALTGNYHKLSNPVPLKWHVNTGMRKVGFDFGDHREFDEVFAFATALEYQPWKYAGIFGEFNHESGFSQLFDSREFKTEPTTATAGVSLVSDFGLRVWGGMVFGLFHSGSIPVEHRDNNGKLLESFNVKGSVPYSMVFGLDWNFGLPQKKVAKIVDIDLDNDGIVDSLDKCANVAEDRDAFEDEDGCPDLDNDADGIPDSTDKCLTQAEDKDGFEDEDGCADLDNDKDGIADADDKCPIAAQDSLGAMGCPATDDDKDGIFGTADKCPNEAEVVNSYLDTDGCVDVVIAKGEKLVLQGIYFKLGAAELTAESMPTLDKLADQLAVLTEVKLEVQGHTDNKGRAASNKTLSKKRAESVVNYLIGKGIAATRLKAIGYGAEKPVAENTTDEGREKNRRVELNRID
jgi:outer membrane protein OmpA-like peptidoglycan-associated protein